MYYWSFSWSFAEVKKKINGHLRLNCLRISSISSYRVFDHHIHEFNIRHFQKGEEPNSYSSKWINIIIVQNDATADFEPKRKRFDLINAIHHIKKNDRAMLCKNVDSLARAINIQGNCNTVYSIWLFFSGGVALNLQKNHADSCQIPGKTHW